MFLPSAEENGLGLVVPNRWCHLTLWLLVGHSGFLVCCFKTEVRLFLTSLMNLSQTPLWWAPKGGLNVHFIPSVKRVFWIFWWFSSFKASCSSLWAPMKFVPQSVLILKTDPLLQMNLNIAFMHESVVRKFAISRCIARLTRQVKMTPPPFHMSSAPLHFNRTKIVDANVTQVPKVTFKSFILIIW